MLAILIVFICKLMDCSLSVLKNIFLIKDKYFFSAICASLSVVFFIYTAQQSGMASYFAIGLATFLGNYLPPKIVERVEQDKVFVFELVAESLEESKKLADSLRDSGIEVTTSIIYDGKSNKNILCRCVSKSKHTSRMIKNYISDDVNCLIRRE